MRIVFDSLIKSWENYAYTHTYYYYYCFNIYLEQMCSVSSICAKMCECACACVYSLQIVVGVEHYQTTQLQLNLYTSAQFTMKRTHFDNCYSESFLYLLLLFFSRYMNAAYFIYFIHWVTLKLNMVYRIHTPQFNDG